MIRVAICDDHQIVRAGFKQFFSEITDIEVVAEATNGKEALDIARKGICDVMLLDINMPGQSGVDTLRTIKQGQPEFPVMILSIYPAPRIRGELAEDGRKRLLEQGMRCRGISHGNPDRGNGSALRQLSHRRNPGARF